MILHLYSSVLLICDEIFYILKQKKIFKKDDELLSEDVCLQFDDNEVTISH